MPLDLDEFEVRKNILFLLDWLELVGWKILLRVNWSLGVQSGSRRRDSRRWEGSS